MTRGSNRAQGRGSGFRCLSAGEVPLVGQQGGGSREGEEECWASRSNQEDSVKLLRELDKSCNYLQESSFILHTCEGYREVSLANYSSAGSEPYAVELAAQLAEELSMQVADNACEASKAQIESLSQAHIQRLLG